MDAFLPILDATDVTELREAVHTYFKRCLPKLDQVHVFLKNVATGETEAERNQTLPTQGVIWETFFKSTLHICCVPDDPDPLLEILNLQPSDRHKIVLLPLSTKQNELRLGIVVACTKSDGLLKEEEKCLGILAKQVSMAYVALQQNNLAVESGSDQLESLVRLCGELHDQDAATLELKVICYLCKQTCSESGFLLLVVPETMELISQVVGNTILPEEKRFPDQRNQVEDIVGIKVHSFLCVPVARKGSDDLVALACLVNKANKQRFTESDIQIVEQCFKYTATVITSTLAFQNERKLKIQTQALLHVAKQLFTRLGESAREDTEPKGLSPFLFAVSRYVSNFRVKHMVCDSALPAGYVDDNKKRPGTRKVVELLDKELTSYTSRSTAPAEEDISPQEANMRLEKRQKRAFSMSIYHMFDPTSVEAELSETSSSCEVEEKGEVLPSNLIARHQNLLFLPCAQNADSISEPSVPVCTSLTSPLHDVDKDQDKESTFYSLELPIPDVNIYKSDSMESVDTRKLKAKASPMSILSKASAVSSDKASVKKQVNLSSQVSVSSNKYRHYIKRKSIYLTAPNVPFREVRKYSPARLASHDSHFYSEVDCLRNLAPSDASYSDGDFLYDLTKLLREIMQEARNLTDSERCSVFLLDQDSDELVATVFDGIPTNGKEYSDELVATVFDGIPTKGKEVRAEIRLPKTQGIAGHVATTGTLLNIKDAYSHPLFYRGIDDTTGFRTRNILCFPIKDEEGVVLGVAQLCNKKTGSYFTTFDEDIASAFAVYCCISISHSLMYKKVTDIHYRYSLANELMMFHMTCLIYKKLQETQQRHRLANELMMFHMQQIPGEEVQELAVKGKPPVTVFHKDYDKFSYIPRIISESTTLAACQAMFEDLGFITRWRLKSDTLSRFLLMVKKGYRNPPYHNWMHAYTVCHFSYLCIKNLRLATCLDDIELLALFVSCLCHDIDHRGTTNSFQIKSQSVLAALYSSEGSVMERHHLAQSMCILNTEGSNIFENLNSKEYQQVLDLMRDIILATDVAHHLRILPSLETMAKEGYQKSDPNCHSLLLFLLMTASDLSDQTKTWTNTKSIAVMIYQEFFSQGDLEKALGENPLEMMDREKASVPDLQISFLNNIAIPVYRLLATFFPKAKEVEDRVVSNRECWERKSEYLKTHHTNEHNLSVKQIISLGEPKECS